MYDKLPSEADRVYEDLSLLDFQRKHPGKRYRCGCYSANGHRWCSEPMTQEDCLCDDCRTIPACGMSRQMYDQTHTREERDALYSLMAQPIPTMEARA